MHIFHRNAKPCPYRLRHSTPKYFSRYPHIQHSWAEINKKKKYTILWRLPGRMTVYSFSTKAIWFRPQNIQNKTINPTRKRRRKTKRNRFEASVFEFTVRQDLCSMFSGNERSNDRRTEPENNQHTDNKLMIFHQVAAWTDFLYSFYIFISAFCEMFFSAFARFSKRHKTSQP